MAIDPLRFEVPRAASRATGSVNGKEAAGSKLEDMTTEERQDAVKDLREQMEHQEGKFLSEMGKKAMESYEKSKTEALKKMAAAATKPKDNSAQLTSRLVSATGQMQVRQIVSSASAAMGNLKAVAATGKGKEAAAARAAVRNLEKVILRAQKKIRDLDREDNMKILKSKAEKDKKLKEAERIKNELRKKRQLRGIREHGYLLDRTNARNWDPSRDGEEWVPDAALPEGAASEAQIAMEAEAIVAAEGGGEVAAVEGGGDVGVALEGSVDVSV